jgi:hypothetical protein
MRSRLWFAVSEKPFYRRCTGQKPLAFVAQAAVFRWTTPPEGQLAGQAATRSARRATRSFPAGAIDYNPPCDIIVQLYNMPDSDVNWVMLLFLSPHGASACPRWRWRQNIQQSRVFLGRFSNTFFGTYVCKCLESLKLLRYEGLRVNEASFLHGTFTIAQLFSSSLWHTADSQADSECPLAPASPGSIHHVSTTRGTYR